MSLYTGRGDGGQTDLRDGARVSKNSARIEAVGTVDELNALLGTVRPTGHEDLDDVLRDVQNHLHVLQADLGNPAGAEGTEDGDDAEAPRIEAGHAETLEGYIDEYDAELPALQAFILPTGGEAGAALHHARAVCRRAERRTVALAAELPMDEAAATYLNRLSDLLFTLARVANRREEIGEEHPTY